MRVAVGLALSAALLFVGAHAAQSEEITLYSARAQSLVDPLVRAFEQESGIRVRVRYGANAQLVGQIMEEGPRSPADLFWGYENSLSALAEAGLFTELPDDVLAHARPEYRPRDAMWMPTSIRVRTLAYSPDRVNEEDIPATVMDLADSQWEARVGWAPTNAGFQTFVTGLRLILGEEETLTWLQEMRANRTKSYGNNTALIQALAAGEIDIALVNHYYLLRFLEADPGFPVAQILFPEGDPGNLLLAAGIGLLSSSSATGPAHEFIEFLLGEEGQAYFTHETYEFPAADHTQPATNISALADDAARLAPPVDMGDLSDLGGTLNLLRSAGVL